MAALPPLYRSTTRAERNGASPLAVGRGRRISPKLRFIFCHDIAQGGSETFREAQKRSWRFKKAQGGSETLGWLKNAQGSSELVPLPTSLRLSQPLPASLSFSQPLSALPKSFTLSKRSITAQPERSEAERVRWPLYHSSTRAERSESVERSTTAQFGPSEAE